ncbi:MAG: AsmA family protein, partial [Terriglobia bacterium]
MTRRKKIFVIGGISFLALLLALAIAIPILIDVDRYRPEIAAYIQEQTGKPAAIGRLSLTLFPTLSIRVDEFALGNPEGFPEGHFVTARRIYAELDRGALWDRRIVIQSLEINDPVITLLSNARGKWNFQNPPRNQANASARRARGPQTAPAAPAFTLGVISRVSITGGQVTAAKLVSATRAAPSYFEARALASELTQVNLNAFRGTQAVALSPGREQGIGNREQRRNVPWIIPASAQQTPPGTNASESTPAASGTLAADLLRFGSFEVTSVKTRVRLFPREVFLDDLNLGLYKGQAAGGLSFDFSRANPAYNAALRMRGVDVASLLDSFPDARGKMTGTMEGSIKLAGVVTNSPDPLAGANGTGQLNIRDGKLPSLNLNRNLMRLARLTQLGPAEGDPSSFSSISADLNLADQRITTQQLTVVGNGVDITAAGSLALAGAGSLNYE